MQFSKLKYWGIILIVTIISCNEKPSSIRLAEINSSYKQDIDIFEPKFIDHFPKQIKSLPIHTIIDSNSMPDHIRLILEIKCSKQYVDSIMYDLAGTAMTKYNANDNYLLVVNRFTTKENRHFGNKFKAGDRAKVEKKCFKNKLPIPNFYDVMIAKTDTTDCKLPKHFTLYVIDAKSGKYMEDKYLTNGMYMPKNWKHGYSKGVAISKKKRTVIYWFIIW